MGRQAGVRGQRKRLPSFPNLQGFQSSLRPTAVPAACAGPRTRVQMAEGISISPGSGAKHIPDLPCTRLVGGDMKSGSCEEGHRCG